MSSNKHESVLSSILLQILLVALVLLLCVSPSNSQLYYSHRNESQSITAVQLWYNGFWKHVRTLYEAQNQR